MATKRQIAANRRNARRSTGPKTAAGKAASSANALRHGLAAARAVVLPDEDGEAYERLRQGVIADLDPAGALQEALAQRIVVLLWRLDRAARLEAELFVHGRLAVQRKEVAASAVRESAAAGLAALLGEADGARREARFQAKRAIDADIRLQAPSSEAASSEAAAAEEAPAEAAPGPVTAPPGGAGPAAPRGPAALAGEDALLQNEANSAQSLEAAAEPRAGAGADPPAGPPGGQPGIGAERDRAAQRPGRRDRGGAPPGAEPSERSERPATEGKNKSAERAPGD